MCQGKHDVVNNAVGVRAVQLSEDNGRCNDGGGL